MDRRSFLVGVGATGGAVLLPSCAPAGAYVPDAAPGAVETFLHTLERGVQAVEQWPAMHRLVAAVFGGAPRAARDHDRDDRLARAAVRSLLVASAFREQPPEVQAHPAVQERMWRALPEMGEATDGVTSLLAGLGPGEHARLREAVRRRPHLAMRVGEALDGEAARIGASARVRMQLRNSAAHLSWRLDHQAPAAVLGEYVEKVQKVAARHAVETAGREHAARAAERAFWRAQAGSFASGGPAAPGAVTGGGAGRRVMTAGGWLLGIGVVAGIVGIVVTSSEFAGVFVITLGGVLFLAGLVVLIVGAAMD